MQAVIVVGLTEMDGTRTLLCAIETWVLSVRDCDAVLDAANDNEFGLTAGVVFGGSQDCTFHAKRIGKLDTGQSAKREQGFSRAFCAPKRVTLRRGGKRQLLPRILTATKAVHEGRR